MLALILALISSAPAVSTPGSVGVDPVLLGVAVVAWYAGVMVAFACGKVVMAVTPVGWADGRLRDLPGFFMFGVAVIAPAAMIVYVAVVVPSLAAPFVAVGLGLLAILYAGGLAWSRLKRRLTSS